MDGRLPSRRGAPGPDRGAAAGPRDRARGAGRPGRRDRPGSLHGAPRGDRDREGPRPCPAAADRRRRDRERAPRGGRSRSGRPGRAAPARGVIRPGRVAARRAARDPARRHGPGAASRRAARRGGSRGSGARRRGRAGRCRPRWPGGGDAGGGRGPPRGRRRGRPRPSRARVRHAPARGARALPATTPSSSAGARHERADARPADPAHDGGGPAGRPAHRARLVHDPLAGPRVPPGARGQPPRPVPRRHHRRARSWPTAASG